TIVDGDVDVAVIVEIGGGQAAAGDGTDEVRSQRVRDFFKLALSEIAKHQQRFLVRHFAVVEIHVIEHGAVQLQNIWPAIIVIIQKLHGNAAQQDGLVADPGAIGVIVEGSIPV